MALSATSGVGISGWPIFKWYTINPLALAESDNGANFLIGEAGISIPLFEIFGIFVLNFKIQATKIRYSIGKTKFIYNFATLKK